MAGYHSGNKFKMICGGNKIKKGICGGNVVYSGASPVTYNVDTDTAYIEEVDSGASCLTPTSFTPSKEGYTFLGWKEDTTADGTVLTDKVMGDEPVTLYAVFQKTITLTMYISGSSSEKEGYQYYNNGNIVNPTFTVENPTKSGLTFLGWSISSSSTDVSYSTIDNLELTENTTIYSVFKYADTTISISNYAFGEESVWFGDLQNRKGIYTVDVSKYYKAQLNTTNQQAQADFSGTTVYVYVSDGTNNTLVVRGVTDVNGNRNNNIVSTTIPQLTFSESTGTKTIYVRTSSSSPTTGKWYLYVPTITLFGRTVVG